jgi:tetratricopeptide (TPR) repeat protein
VSTTALRTGLAVSRAAAIARRGDLDAAAVLLTDLPDDDPAVLDLLARIRAQQGRWPEADQHWARVLELDPANATAARGRAVIAAILAGKRRQRPIGQAVVLATAGTTLAVLLAAGVVVLPGEPTPRAHPASAPPASAPSADQALAERRRAEDLRRQLDRIEADQTAATRRRTAQLDAISKALAMPGVIVKRRPEAVEIYFRDGLFSSELRLTSTGADLLTDVGRQLAKLDASITVVGHSVAVPGGRTSGGSGTALDRAHIAARRLADAAHLPLTAFTIRTADQREGPFEQAARNRTASLILTPTEPGPR